MTAIVSSGAGTDFFTVKERALSRWHTLWDGTKPVITVGTATCGRAAGALEVLKSIRAELTRHNIDAATFEVGCMGHCYAEPVVTVAKPGYPKIVYGYVTPQIAQRLVQDYILGGDVSPEFALGALEENELIPAIYDLPRFNYEKPVILSTIGLIDPNDIDHYLATNGYEAMIRVFGMSRQDVINEIEQSGLRGRGGAGFPTAKKLQICHDSPSRPKYVICNADEGDPGAFMDRAILESNPHSVIEGMIIAAYAVGARYGYIYIRAEYPLAIKRIRSSLREARRLRLLGRNIMGSGFDFDIKIFEGSGAFVCGEETALIASIEGKPGLPHHRPPYPAVNGLYSKPTAICNVKTLSYIPCIINNGAGWFSDIGTKGSKGTAVFALAGKVVNTGLTEVPMGTALREIIFNVGGGIPKGKRFKAVQIGGPSGGCLPESALDLPVDFESLREAGAIMGSGGMVILDEDDCMVEVARYFLEFTQRESCGKCTMCRLGTRQMLEILEDITKGNGRAEDLETLYQLAQDVKVGSLCGLGKTAPNPVLTTMRYFLDEYTAHIEEGRCPALMCPDLISYHIIPEKCERSCDACVGTCTVEAIFSDKKRIKVIDQDKCIKCGTCLDACPIQYSAIVKLSPPQQVPAMKESL